MPKIKRIKPQWGCLGSKCACIWRDNEFGGSVPMVLVAFENSKGGVEMEVDDEQRTRGITKKGLGELVYLTQIFQYTGTMKKGRPKTSP
jgi:hypothetical protein